MSSRFKKKRKRRTNRGGSLWPSASRAHGLSFPSSFRFVVRQELICTKLDSLGDLDGREPSRGSESTSSSNGVVQRLKKKRRKGNGSARALSFPLTPLLPLPSLLPTEAAPKLQPLPPSFAPTVHAQNRETTGRRLTSTSSTSLISTFSKIN